MGHEDNGNPLNFVQLLEDRHDLGARFGVQVAGRFVGQDDGRIVDQRAGDGDPLLLAPRQLVGLVIQPVAQTYPRQCCFGARAAILAAGVDQRQLNVGKGCGTRQQVEALEDEADLAAAHGGQLVFTEVADVLAVQKVVAAGGLVQAADDVHHR